MPSSRCRILHAAAAATAAAAAAALGGPYYQGSAIELVGELVSVVYYCCGT